MKFIAIGLALAALATGALAQPMNTLTPAEQKAGWKLLFDGRTTEGWRGFRAPSHWGSAVAGVQNPSRQQSSLVPFFQTEPSVARQLSAGLPCAKAPDKGAASAADANSNATLFSFFIDSPLKESRS